MIKDLLLCSRYLLIYIYITVGHIMLHNAPSVPVIPSEVQCHGGYHPVADPGLSVYPTLNLLASVLY